MGWGRTLGAAKVAETHVVTSEANFEVLVRARTEGLLPGNVYFYTPKPDARLRYLERKPPLFAYNYRAYHHWQILTRQLITDLHLREHFDLVHQVNVCTFREPGYGHMLDIPFIWGPVGGTQNFPTRFLTTLSPAEAVKEGLRSLANRLALRKIRVRRAAARAATLFAANSTNARDFAKVLRKNPESLLETGLHEVAEPDRSRYQTRLAKAQSSQSLPALRLLWSGELQTRKALPILLRALALLPADVAWKLDVLGDGPMRERWEEQSRRLGLATNVQFLGSLPFPDATRYMHSADLFCFSSLRDTSGNVVLEALAAGVPIVCFDHQGASDMVSASCGVKLHVGSPRSAYMDWARTIEALARDPERLLRFSYGATQQARKFLWVKNHDVMNALYGRLVKPSTNGSARRVNPTSHGEIAIGSSQAGLL